MDKKLEKILEHLACHDCTHFITVIIQVVARVILSTPSTWTVEVEGIIPCGCFYHHPVVHYRNPKMINSCTISPRERKNHSRISQRYSYRFYLVVKALGSYDPNELKPGRLNPTVQWMKSGYLYLVMLIGTCDVIFSVHNTVTR
jgi:hypothetical protein